ncbi:MULTISPECIES: hypothetical protein [Streptomyces]|uniref:Uncharacterized protein n=3 Tax=Streptomyces rimosus TaxID=1927 RepID=L8F141_STRR1|nr:MULTISPECIES: hypothetical protein [Streptomyces]KOG73045.1 hypothetical protein ADK78_17425 [Kitasatospora aureofaciens]MYT42108.1 hypothetical protein [Streptomyces sp. SID5471]KEF04809.1 hypothetical protein DF17_21410 [Streptomyces rimosus]KUJ35098.1 hypothetical protein ADK46_16765 [Streptomyces rimosus subsp. rimosus]QDA10212.1 hypothetical protein CTZ40_41235 [Streptomyces rimosus]
MHDPTTPGPDPDSAQDPAGAQPPDGVGYAVAEEVVGRVIAWYSQRIQEERRAGAAPQRLEDLVARRRACVEDRHRLEEAGPEEVARITALYAARLKELEVPGPQ